MIRFACPHCGAKLRVADALAGRKGKCPHCSQVVIVPPAGTHASRTDAPRQPGTPASHAAAPGPIPRPDRLAPAPSQPAGPAAATGPRCPSCSRTLPEGARICGYCGIKLPNGRPLLTARAPDEDLLLLRGEKVTSAVSWLIGIGLYPVYSEAPGRARPYVTWAIAALTVIVSLWFLGLEWTDSPSLQRHKQLLLWTGDQPASAERIAAFYKLTTYGNVRAFGAAYERLPEDVPERERIVRAHESLPVEDRAIGQYRPHQLLTNALLHGGILHLAGNLVFLFVFGSRVNAAVGNVRMLLLYPLLAVTASYIFLVSAAGQEPGPALGASGAIMGLAGMYLVLFPLHKVHMVAWLRWGLLAGFHLSRRFFALPGILIVLFYISFDVLYISLDLETGTAHWAHLGGFLTGMAVAVVLLVARQAYSGADALSLVLGRGAWPLLGTPAARTGLAPSDAAAAAPRRPGGS